LAEFSKDDIDPYIETVSGTKFYFLDPSWDSIKIGDIAHALGNICRYMGHSSRFYSVAEHSVAVSHITGTLEGLLHDASEAYLTDVASPVKPHLQNYKKLESTIMGAIAKRFGITWPLSEETHYADLQMLSTESFFLIPSRGEGWRWENWHPKGRPDVDEGLAPWGHDPKMATEMFLRRFEELS